MGVSADKNVIASFGTHSFPQNYPCSSVFIVVPVFGQRPLPPLAFTRGAAVTSCPGSGPLAMLLERRLDVE